MGIGTRQGSGGIGGPWILNYRAQQWGAKNYSNGVFAFMYTAQPNEMFSPFFDTWVKDQLWSEAIVH